jgi:hypothetical protein
VENWGDVNSIYSILIEEEEEEKRRMVVKIEK